MSDIGAVSGSSTQSAATKAGVGLAQNFNNFLTLLTTQLRYQDPLSPMDPKEFTQQLVQMTSVEQAIATNQNLEKIIQNLSASTNASVVNYIGKEIEADGATAMLDKGRAEWKYTLAQDAKTVQIRVLDANGTLVYLAQGETARGEHAFVWNGSDNNGVPRPDGLYTINITATNANNAPVSTSTGIVGKVTGFETSSDGIVLHVGALKVPYTDINLVRAPLQPGT